MAQHGTAATDVFTKITAVCQSLGPVTSDQLKRQAILNEMLAKLPSIGVAKRLGDIRLQRQKLPCAMTHARMSATEIAPNVLDFDTGS